MVMAGFNCVCRAAVVDVELEVELQADVLARCRPVDDDAGERVACPCTHHVALRASGGRVVAAPLSKSVAKKR